jgi:hypothetical protein
MVYQEPFYYNPTRKPALIVIALFLIFAFSYSTVSAFVKKATKRPEINLYFAASPAPILPHTAPPQQLPIAQDSFIDDTSPQELATSAIVTTHTVPQTGPGNLLFELIGLIGIGIVLTGLTKKFNLNHMSKKSVQRIVFQICLLPCGAVGLLK